MTKKFLTDTPSIAEIRSLKKPNTRSVTLLVDTEVAKKVTDLEKLIRTEERKDAKQNRTPVAPRLKKDLEVLREEAANYEAEFVFQDIGRERLDQLISEHRPSDELLEDQPEAEWDPDTFSPTLISECAIKPLIPLADATSIWNEWSQAETQSLFLAALGVCLERASIPFTRTDTDEIQDFVSKLITAESGESRTDGSLAGN